MLHHTLHGVRFIWFTKNSVVDAFKTKHTMMKQSIFLWNVCSSTKTLCNMLFKEK